MTKTRFLFAVACGFLIVSGCSKTGSNNSNEFKEFASAEGRFKVLMPGTPKEESQAAAGTNMKTYSLTEKEGAYMVAFADLPLPKGMKEPEIQKRLDGARDGMLSNVGGKLTNSSKITLSGKYPGREVQATLPKQQDGLLIAKIYFVNQRLYQIMVTGTKAWAGSADATKFLDSLVVTQ